MRTPSSSSGSEPSSNVGIGDSPPQRIGSPAAIARIAWRNWRHGYTTSQPNDSGVPSSSRLALARARRINLHGKAFLVWVLVCYVAVQLTMLPIKDQWRTIGPANEARKWPAFDRLIAKNPERPLVLMLGSSRTCWAFDAGSLDGMKGPNDEPLSVYNFGIPTAGPVHQLLYLREMLEKRIRPRLLLVEYLPPLMAEPVRGALTEESMTRYSWMSGKDFVRTLPYLTRPERRSREWVEARIAPWYAFRQNIQMDLYRMAKGDPRQDYPAVDAWGWHPMNPTPFPAEERARLVDMARQGYTPGLTKYVIGKKPSRAMREILQLCARENVPTALVLMPESTEFRSWYSEEAQTASRGFLAELSRTYRSPIVDAEQWLVDEDFEDGHHVLAHGAAAFTQRLKAEILRLLADQDELLAER